MPFDLTSATFQYSVLAELTDKSCVIYLDDDFFTFQQYINNLKIIFN